MSRRIVSLGLVRHQKQTLLSVNGVDKMKQTFGEKKSLLTQLINSEGTEDLY